MSSRRRPARPGAASARADAVPSPPPTGLRLAGIDALRGGALCLMFVYHFAFDLRFYRVIAADFEHDPFWLGFRALIVASFMALVGVSLVLADRAGVAPARFWRRIGVIAACALAVSVASWIMFPHSFIYFGILHGIAVASVLARPLVGRPRTALVVGCLVIAAGFGWSNAAFDAGPLSWIGFVTVKPATEDYVPLAPWAGFVFLGIALGHRIAGDAFSALAPIATAPGWLRWLGRHSLAVYMVHQPILLGALWLALRR
jgi:uncharacterized membrane protein